VHLAAIVDGPAHVCCRYRLAAFQPFLQAAGHTLELIPWPRHWWSRLNIGQCLKQADAVVIQRRLLPSLLLHMVRRSARHLVFDFDDSVWQRDSYATRGMHSDGRVRRFAAMVCAADTVVAGNGFLDAQAGRWVGTERRIIIPTCVDVDRYPLSEHALSGAGVKLVWVGSSSTLQGLEAVQPLLEHLGTRLPGLQFKLICDQFLPLRHLAVVPCRWTEAGESTEIAAADIGISWVPDDPWSRGKCGLKVLQYMAAGLPVVANPVGVQADLVRHGETGFLASTAADWLEAVGRLMHDPELRRRMGGAGRSRVEAEFSVQRGAERWLGLLDRVEARRRVA